MLETNYHRYLEDFGWSYFDLDALDEQKIPKMPINQTLLHEHGIFPFGKQGKIIYLGLTKIIKQSILDEIRFLSGLIPHCVYVDEKKLLRFSQKLINQQHYTAIHHDQKLETTKLEDAPLVRYIQEVIADGIKKNASDIHFEPFNDFLKIRFRIDGILHDVANAPKNLINLITTRLKILAELDIAEKRIPQDGRFNLDNLNIDFRVSTCPTTTGEKIVLRILESKPAILNLDQLGFTDQQKKLFINAITKPQGMILVTGPTGSGKTRTLYSALAILNKPEVNIVTVEDPVEINLPGINQVNINPKAGLNFATTLRAFLRQDPDIIMVGEIRDLETAEIAIKAAQTGHLVLSTLHTNNTAEAITRLRNMGIAPYNIISALSLIIAQRLARKLCEFCKSPSQATNNNLYQAMGCEDCNSGYKDRTGIFEVMPITSLLRDHVLQSENSHELQRLAIQAGMQTLRQSGIKLVEHGITSLVEINRVTKD